NVQELEIVEQARARLLSDEHDRVFVRSLDIRNPLAHHREVADARLRVRCMLDVRGDVRTGELAPGVEFHTLTEFEGDLASVSAEVPALRQLRYGLASGVVLNEAVVYLVHDVEGGGRHLVGLEIGQLGGDAQPDAATRPRLSSGSGLC